MPLHYCRHCGGPVNLTEDEKRAILERFREGAGATEIAREFRVSRQVVYRVTESIRFPEEVGQGALFDETRVQED